MALPFSFEDVEFRPLSPDCARGAFRCGNDDVDGWFKTKATTEHGACCRVTTAHVRGRECPVAYFTLKFAINDLNRKVLPEFDGVGRFPSLHLEWLGVQEELQRHRLGEFVMGRVLQVFSDTIFWAQVPALTVLPADEHSMRFYRRLGFVPLNVRWNKTWVLSATAMRTLDII